MLLSRRGLFRGAGAAAAVALATPAIIRLPGLLMPVKQLPLRMPYHLITRLDECYSFFWISPEWTVVTGGLA